MTEVKCSGESMDTRFVVVAMDGYGLLTGLGW